MVLKQVRRVMFGGTSGIRPVPAVKAYVLEAGGYSDIGHDSCIKPEIGTTKPVGTGEEAFWRWGCFVFAAVSKAR